MIKSIFWKISKINLEIIYFKFENKKNQKNVIAFKLNIIPRNIYANFLPINAVYGSSFTLITSSNYLDKDSINLVINLRLMTKNNKFVFL